jgi:lysozyme
MPMNPLALALIERHEGCRLTAYRDTLGNWTVGYGCTGPDIGEGTCWSQDQADAELESRAGDVEAELARKLAFWARLDPVRQAVLIDMGFNLGVEGLLGFAHTLGRIAAGDYAGASAAMLLSKWAQEVGERAAQDAAIMRTGVAQ